MRLFFELARRSFQRQLTYRAATIAGLVTNFFFGVLRVAVLTAFYGVQAEVNGLSLQGAITFTGLTQAIIGYLSLFGWYEVMNSIYTGAVATDLLKPMGYYRFWMAQDLGRAVAQLVMRALPIMLAYAIFFPITWPKSVGQWLALVVAMALAWMISFSVRFLANLAGFWTPNALGFVRFAFILMYFLTGFLMPLRFFPDWFVRLCNLTPFPYIINTVVEIFLGVLTGPQIVVALLSQLGWVVILGVACQLILRAGVRRLVIQGG